MNPRTRERKDWKGEEKRKEGRKHQHHFMDTINISNLVLGEFNRRVLFLDSPSQE